MGESETLLYSRDEVRPRSLQLDLSWLTPLQAFRWKLYRMLLASECDEARQLWRLDTPEEIDRLCRERQGRMA